MKILYHIIYCYARVYTVKQKTTRVGGFLRNGARAWGRTKDLSSISRMLYQLSYTRKFKNEPRNYNKNYGKMQLFLVD